VAIVTIDIELSPFPQIAVDPAILMFGDVLVGASQTLEVNITNTGTAPLTLDMADVTPAAATAFTVQGVSELPVTIEPGMMLPLPLQVTFAPTTAGALMGTLHLRSNAPEATVALRGIGVPIPVPLLEITPATLDFGEVVVGEEPTQTLTVRNSGTADLHLSAVALDNMAAFSLSGLPVLPTTVSPGGTVTIDVTFKPPTDDTLTGTLLLHSNVVNTPSPVTLRGTGIPETGSTGSTGGTD
jgi:hypothetical protein